MAIAATLYKLLPKKFKWEWSKNEEEAFLKLKSTVVSGNLLAHYDEKNPLVMALERLHCM